MNGDGYFRGNYWPNGVAAQYWRKWFPEFGTSTIISRRNGMIIRILIKLRRAGGVYACN